MLLSMEGRFSKNGIAVREFPLAAVDVGQNVILVIL